MLGPRSPNAVRNSVGDDAPLRAGERLPRDAVGVDAANDLGIVAGDRPDVDTGVAAPQRVRRDPRILERLPTELEREPLLRIHRRRLARGDAKQAGVEAVDLVKEAAAPQLRGDVPGAGQAEHRQAVRRHLTDRVAPVPEKGPELLGVRRSRQPTRHPDHGHPGALIHSLSAFRVHAIGGGANRP